MAQDPDYADVQFVSICCDKLDGAREIIEKDDEIRWQHVSHYFMEPEDKEAAKEALGFKSVPFYVVINKEGVIQQMGGTKQIDFESIPGKLQSVENKENDRPEDSPMKTDSGVERVFVLDDLDF